MTSRERPERGIAAFTRALDEAGYASAIVLDPEDYRELLTPRREELLETIAGEERLSVTELAAELERDEGAVSRDLSVLFEYNVIDFEREGIRKIPVVKFETILPEPLVLDELGETESSV